MRPDTTMPILPPTPNALSSFSCQLISLICYISFILQVLKCIYSSRSDIVSFSFSLYFQTFQFLRGLANPWQYLLQPFTLRAGSNFQIIKFNLSTASSYSFALRQQRCPLLCGKNPATMVINIGTVKVNDKHMNIMLTERKTDHDCNTIGQSRHW